MGASPGGLRIYLAERNRAALEAARHPEARVRTSLVTAVGWSREPRELQVLEQLLVDVEQRRRQWSLGFVEASRRGRRNKALVEV